MQPRQLCGAFDLCVSATGERDGDGLGSGVTGERVGLGEVEELLEGEVAQLGVLRVRRGARTYVLVVVRDDALQPPLVLRDLQQVHVERLQRDQPVHGHGALLPEAMRAVHGLDVLLRVLGMSAEDDAHPVGVVEHHGVGGAEVDAQPARARGEQEHGHGGVGVEALDGVLARLLQRGAVDGAVVPAAEEAVVLQQVQRLALTPARRAHLHELHEHEHAVAAGNELLQHGVEHGELGGLGDGGLVGDVLPAAARLLVDVAGVADELAQDLHAEVARGGVQLQVVREDELLVASVVGADDVVSAGERRGRPYSSRSRGVMPQ